MQEMNIVYLPVDDLIPYEHNAKQHPEKQVEHIANSIREFGFRQPIVVDAENVVVIGHGRLLAAQKLGLEAVPVVRADDLTEEQIKALRLADNKTNESEWDFGELEAELADLALDFDMSEFGFEDISANTDSEPEEERKGSLAAKYLVPPFSVIYANKPDWLQRKRAWVDMGLHSEIGRGGDLLTIQGAIQRQTSYGNLGGTLRNEQSLQEQRKVKQLHERSQALATFTIARMRQMQGR